MQPNMAFGLVLRPLECIALQLVAIFSDVIPVQVVDEALYTTPPSFLIGTIDKFARMAWRDEANAFFNGGPQKRKPPSLVSAGRTASNFGSAWDYRGPL